MKKRTTYVIAPVNEPSNERPYVPCTPAGTPCTWLAAPTEEQAWENLLRDAAHMPYDGIEGFKARGYTVEFWRTVR